MDGLEQRMVLDAIRGRLGGMIAEQVERSNLLEATTKNDVDEAICRMNFNAVSQVIDYLSSLPVEGARTIADLGRACLAA